MVVETRAPREVFELEAGDSCLVSAKRAHHVAGKNGRGCKFAVLQGSAPTISIPWGDQRTLARVGSSAET
jgi:hypothetical protein